MDVEIIDGNLLDFPNNINSIAHSCNTHNVMGAGIAHQIKYRYPNAYSADCYAMMNNDNQLGWYSFSVTDATQNKGIYNMYTQDKIGSKRAVNYEAFYVALNKVADHMEWRSKHEDEEKTLGLPYGISCGLAGGNWGIIKAMIEDIFLDSPIKCYIVRYHE